VIFRGVDVGQVRHPLAPALPAYLEASARIARDPVEIHAEGPEGAARLDGPLDEAGDDVPVDAGEAGGGGENLVGEVEGERARGAGGYESEFWHKSSSRGISAERP
jgi:hypothetical protein